MPYTRRHIPFGANNFLSVLEGVEGGFAIFAGVITGLYFQDISQDLLIVSGVVGLVVSAFNSSAVRFATEHYLDELDGHEKRSKLRAYFLPALVEFITYSLASLIAVLPLLVIDDTLTAVILTIIITLCFLFSAGFYRGKLLGRHALRDGFELANIGISIIAIGGLSGWLLAYLLN